MFFSRTSLLKEKIDDSKAALQKYRTQVCCFCWDGSRKEMEVWLMFWTPWFVRKWSTLPETNSSPPKIGLRKRKPVFQPMIFRGHVSLPEGLKLTSSHLKMLAWNMMNTSSFWDGAMLVLGRVVHFWKLPKMFSMEVILETIFEVMHHKI